MTKVAKKIAKDLLDIEAVFLNPNEPFTWASGIKSPIYCDNRITMSYPAVRKEIAEGLAAKIKETFPEVEVIAGTATAGIPHAAWVADIFEDLISTGGSVLEAAEAAEREGATVLGVAAIFTYELPKGTANFADKQMTLLTLTNYSTLIDAALEANYIEEKDVTLLQEWKKDPENWGK